MRAVHGRIGSRASQRREAAEGGGEGVKGGDLCRRLSAWQGQVRVALNGTARAGLWKE
jgi:hypothetical protein